MNTLDTELEQLKSRSRKAEQYFSAAYLTDTAENRDKAEKAYKQLQDKIVEIWEQMSRTIILDPELTVDEWLEGIEQYKADYLYPVRVDCYRVSKRIEVRLERPGFWRDLVTKVMEG